MGEQARRSMRRTSKKASVGAHGDQKNEGTSRPVPQGEAHLVPLVKRIMMPLGGDWLIHLLTHSFINSFIQQIVLNTCCLLAGQGYRVEKDRHVAHSSVGLIAEDPMFPCKFVVSMYSPQTAHCHGCCLRNSISTACGTVHGGRCQ